MVLSNSEVRAFCLDLPDASEEYPFGRSPEVCTFKVAGKVFALSRFAAAPPLQISLKCDPQIAQGLRSAYPAIAAGYHLNKQHWNTVTVDDSISDDLIREMIQDSWDLVVDTLPKWHRIRLR